MIKRRTFIAGLGSAAAWPMVARAQQSFPVIGWLWSGTPDGAQKYLDAFLSGLAESGYVVNKNVRIEYRWAQNKYERLPVLASDLVERHVAVIIGNGLISTLAAKYATAVVPIVFNVGADPIKSGLVTSLNRPRGNLTGVAALIEALGPKRLELVHDLLPDARYIGVLFNDSNPTAQTQVEELKIAAASKGVVLQPISIQDQIVPVPVEIGEAGAIG